MAALVILGGVDLPDLLMENRIGPSAVHAEVAQSLAGTPIVFEEYKPAAGNNIDLVSGDWVEKSVITEIKALADIPEGQYTLEYNGESYNVRFRHEDAPPIEGTLVQPLVDDSETDYFEGVRIKLMQI